MGKSMKKFKKLAALAITIPTLLSSTNISFAMKSPVQSNVHAPQEQSMRISLNQLSLGGQGSVLFNKNVPYNNTYCFITIQPNFTPTGTQNIFIANGLLHDAYGRIYNENEYFTYANGKPIQLPLQQQQFEVIPSEQCHYNTVDNSPSEQEEIQEQNEQVENNKSPKPPKSTQETAKTRKYCKHANGPVCCECGQALYYSTQNNKYKYYKCRNEKCTYCKDKQTFRSDEDSIVITAGGKSKGGKSKGGKSKKLDCVDCKCRGKECVAKNGTFITKGGIKMQRYRCAKCMQYFTLDENGKVVKKVDRKPEYVECTNPKCPTYGTEEKCARPHRKYTRKDGTQMQIYKCKTCKKYFTQPINKNAEKQAGIETQPN